MDEEDPNEQHHVVLHFPTKNSKLVFNSQELVFRIKLVLKRSETLLNFLARFAFLQGRLYNDNTGFEVFASMNGTIAKLDNVDKIPPPFGLFGLNTVALLFLVPHSGEKNKAENKLESRDSFTLSDRGKDEKAKDDKQQKDEKQKDDKQKEKERLFFIKHQDFYHFPLALLSDAISGEVIIDCIPKTFYFETKKKVIPGTLWVSNFRLTFLPYTDHTNVVETFQWDTVQVPLAMITNLSKGQENVIGGGSEHMGTGKDKKPKKEKKIRKVVWFRLRTIDFRQLQFGWMKDGIGSQHFTKVVVNQLLSPFGGLLGFFSQYNFEIQNEAALTLLVDRPHVSVNWTTIESPIFPPYFGFKSGFPSRIRVPAAFAVSVGQNLVQHCAYALKFYKGKYPALSWTNEYGTALLRTERMILPEDEKKMVSKVQKVIKQKGDNQPVSDILKTMLESKFNFNVVFDSIIKSIKGDTRTTASSGHQHLFLFNTGEVNGATISSKNYYSQVGIPWNVLNLQSTLQVQFKELHTLMCSETKITTATDLGWSKQVHLLMTGCQIVVEFLTENSPCCVLLENGGDDLDGAVACLVQICVDQAFHTIEGFCRLVNKEWVQNSFPWFSNCGNGQPKHNSTHNLSDSDDIRPGCAQFLLFLNCVWQMSQEKSSIFEFSEDLLIFLFDCASNGRFGTFSFDSEFERSKGFVCPSIWPYILENPTRWKNPFYKKQPLKFPLEFKTDPQSILIWESLLMRHQSRSIDAAREINSLVRSAVTTSSTEFKLERTEFIIKHVPHDSFVLWAVLTEHVSLIDNKLIHFPHTLASMSNLKTLTIKGNSIPVIGDIIKLNLLSLDTLILENNKIRTIDLSDMPNLTYLSLCHNNLSSFPTKFSSCPKLIEVNLSHNQISTFPQDLASPVEKLNLSKNVISTIKIDWNSQLPKLKHLDLSSNGIFSFPSSLIHCLTIESLDLSTNNISLLSWYSVVMPSLQYLDLTSNQLASMDPIMVLSSLKVLKIARNKFTQVPLTIRGLNSLTALDLSNNPINCLTYAVGQINTLQELDIRGLEVESLPLTLANLVNLDRLWLDKHRKWQPVELRNLIISATKDDGEIAPSPKPLVRWFTNELQKPKPLNRTKLMIVGPAGCGRTSLLQALSTSWSTPTGNTENSGEGQVEQFAKLRERKKATQSSGITISNYSFPFPNNPAPGQNQSRMNLSVWDFAGQLMTLSIHQLFMTSKTFYLLVFDLTKASTENKVVYWLQMLRARCQGVSIVIVGTHSDCLSTTPEQRAERIACLQQQWKLIHTGVKAIYMVNVGPSSKDSSLQTLRTQLETLITSTKHTTEQVPQSVFLYESFLREQERRLELPVVSFNYLQALARSAQLDPLSYSQARLEINPIEFKQSQRLIDATLLLHDLGTVVYFNDDPKLSQIVILDIQWLASIITSLFCSHSWVRNGIVHHADLLYVWKKYPPSIHNSLLYILQSFDIAFELKKTDLADWYSMAVPQGRIRSSSTASPRPETPHFKSPATPRLEELKSSLSIDSPKISNLNLSRLKVDKSESSMNSPPTPQRDSSLSPPARRDSASAPPLSPHQPPVSPPFKVDPPEGQPHIKVDKTPTKEGGSASPTTLRRLFIQQVENRNLPQQDFLSGWRRPTSGGDTMGLGAGRRPSGDNPPLSPHHMPPASPHRLKAETPKSGESGSHSGKFSSSSSEFLPVPKLTSNPASLSASEDFDSSRDSDPDLRSHSPMSVSPPSRTSPLVTPPVAIPKLSLPPAPTCPSPPYRERQTVPIAVPTQKNFPPLPSTRTPIGASPPDDPPVIVPHSRPGSPHSRPFLVIDAIECVISVLPPEKSHPPDPPPSGTCATSGVSSPSGGAVTPPKSPTKRLSLSSNPPSPKRTGDLISKASSAPASPRFTKKIHESSNPIPPLVPLAASAGPSDRSVSPSRTGSTVLKLKPLDEELNSGYDATEFLGRSTINPTPTFAPKRKEVMATPDSPSPSRPAFTVPLGRQRSKSEFDLPTQTQQFRPTKNKNDPTSHPNGPVLTIGEVHRSVIAAASEGKGLSAFEKVGMTPAGIEPSFDLRMVGVGIPVNEENLSLLPDLLPLQLIPTGRKRVESLWPKFPQDCVLLKQEKMSQIHRSYQFRFLPSSLITRFLIHIFRYFAPIELWRGGVLAESRSSKGTMILVEHVADDSSADDSDKSLSLVLTDIQKLEHSLSEFREVVKQNSKIIPSDWQVLQALFSTVNTQVERTWSNHSCLTFPLRLNELSIQVRSTDATEAQNHFGVLVDTLGEICSSWHRLDWECSAFSPQALIERQLFPDRFQLSKIEEELFNGDDNLAKLVAPDLALSQFEGKRVDWKEVTRGEEIGAGGFAVVHRGEWNKQTVALKIFHPKGGPGGTKTTTSNQAKDLWEFRHEIMLQSKLKHPNIVQILAASLHPLCVILEFIPGGTLHHFLHEEKEKVLLWKLRLRMALELAKGIQFLHEGMKEPIVHLDLKTPNILINSFDPKDVNIKIADFGTSRVLRAPIKGRYVDNPTWLAPEILLNYTYGEKVDTYAYGVILYELIARKLFFEDFAFLSDIEAAVIKGSRPPLPSIQHGCPALFASLIEECWAGNPSSRPAWSAIMAKLENLDRSDLAHYDVMQGRKQSQDNLESAELDGKARSQLHLQLQEERALDEFLARVTVDPITEEPEPDHESESTESAEAELRKHDAQESARTLTSDRPNSCDVAHIDGQFESESSRDFDASASASHDQNEADQDEKPFEVVADPGNSTAESALLTNPVKSVQKATSPLSVPPISTKDIDDVCDKLKDSTILPFLVLYGGVNQLNSKGQTLLYFSVSKGFTRVVLQLLNSASIDLDFQFTDGNTALHVATINNFGAIVALLLMAGASVTKKNVLGSTPQQSNYHPTIEKLYNQFFAGETLKIGMDYPLIIQLQKVREESNTIRKREESQEKVRRQLYKTRFSDPDSMRELIVLEEENQDHLTEKPKTKYSVGSLKKKDKRKVVPASLELFTHFSVSDPDESGEKVSLPLPTSRGGKPETGGNGASGTIETVTNPQAPMSPGLATSPEASPEKQKKYATWKKKDKQKHSPTRELFPSDEALPFVPAVPTTSPSSDTPEKPPPQSLGNDGLVYSSILEESGNFVEIQEPPLQLHPIPKKIQETPPVSPSPIRASAGGVGAGGKSEVELGKSGKSSKAKLGLGRPKKSSKSSKLALPFETHPSSDREGDDLPPSSPRSVTLEGSRSSLDGAPPSRKGSSALSDSEGPDKKTHSTKRRRSFFSLDTDGGDSHPLLPDTDTKKKMSRRFSVGQGSARKATQRPPPSATPTPVSPPNRPQQPIPNPTQTTKYTLVTDDITASSHQQANITQPTQQEKAVDGDQQQQANTTQTTQPTQQHQSAEESQTAPQNQDQPTPKKSISLNASASKKGDNQQQEVVSARLPGTDEKEKLAKRPLIRRAQSVGSFVDKKFR